MLVKLLGGGACIYAARQVATVEARSLQLRPSVIGCCSQRANNQRKNKRQKNIEPNKRDLYPSQEKRIFYAKKEKSAFYGSQEGRKE